MEDTTNLPPPDVIADEILEDLRAALEQLEEIAGDDQRQLFLPPNDNYFCLFSSCW